jgi:hypothetical protein
MHNLARSLLVVLTAALVGACAASAPTRSPLSTLPVMTTSAPSLTPLPSGQPTLSSTAPSATPVIETPTPIDTSSAEPGDSGGTTTGGDIPDNAVFLTYHDAAHGFAIEYVEGWQVTPAADGVVMRDKDSSEQVTVVPPVADVVAYFTSIDLPALQAVSGFEFVKQDTVTVKGVALNHIVYHAPSPPDPVTGKQVSSTLDRYYVPGSSGLAIVTLSTPDGVDNVDAFREMIKSFAWQ